MSVQALPVLGLPAAVLPAAYLPDVETPHSAVFVTTSPRRRRAVRAAGWCVAMLAAGWFAAFGVGAAGFGSLPQLPQAPVIAHGAGDTVRAAGPAQPTVKPGRSWQGRVCCPGPRPA